MILATYNVNSIRMREDRLLRWLSTRQPDVVCLQELKCTNDDFPTKKIEDAGYHAVVHGQRSYNGVAILSRKEPSDVKIGLGRKELDEEARLLAATIEGVRVLCAYVPAGGEDSRSAKYSFKIKWLRALIDYLKEESLAAREMVLCGDFNIAADDRDVSLLDKWRGSAVFNPELTAMYEEFLALGLADSFRQHNTEGGLYTWWDYNDLCYQRNEGLRIDHIMIPKATEDRCYRCWVDWEERQGTKPSDHAPVMADFDWARVRSRDSEGAGVGQKRDRSRSITAPADVAYGPEAARAFIVETFPDQAASVTEESTIRVRFATGFEEQLLWNYFPAGVRQWKWSQSESWVDASQSQS